MIIILAYNSPIDNLIDSIPGYIPIHLFVHSDHRYDRFQTHSNIIFYPYYANRGLSNSWNEGMINIFKEDDVAILVNDDCVFSKGDVIRMIEKSQEGAGTIAENLAAHAFSCIAINKKTFETVGCFDQNFFPAYFEDLDYARRVTLSGLAFTICKGTNVHHTKSYNYHNNDKLRKQQLKTFPKNEQYYQSKWGGKIGQERYDKPFNKWNNYISPDARFDPYPGRLRNDHHIVKI
jgi:GT2 family glycosyltransferase